MLHCRTQSGRIAHIALDLLDAGALQTAQVTAGSHQYFDLVTAREQFMGEVCADEAGSAGDEAIHTRAMIRFPCISSNQIGAAAIQATRTAVLDKIG
jgi:hypothetical protein